MSTQNDRISELAKEDPKRQFYSIGHMITPEALYAAFRGLRKKASAGVDGVTYEEYERDVARNVQTLHERLKNGKYQAQPLRRVYIPKENGKQRPLSIPALAQVSGLSAPRGPASAENIKPGAAMKPIGSPGRRSY
jgi:retron-type reverse transcriptase